VRPALEEMKRRERRRERGLTVAAERLAADVDRRALYADTDLDERVAFVVIERIRIARLLPRERQRVSRSEPFADRPAARELDAERIARHRRRVVELEEVTERGELAPFEAVRRTEQHEIALPLADRRIRTEHSVHLVRVRDVEPRLAETDLGPCAVERLLVLPPADVADEARVAVDDALAPEREHRALERTVHDREAVHRDEI